MACLFINTLLRAPNIILSAPFDAINCGLQTSPAFNSYLGKDPACYDAWTMTCWGHDSDISYMSGIRLNAFSDSGNSTYCKPVCHILGYILFHKEPIHNEYKDMQRPLRVAWVLHYSRANFTRVLYQCLPDFRFHDVFL
jgi:hypothetical protein